MKKSNLFIFLLVACASSSFGQKLNLEKTKFIGGDYNCYSTIKAAAPTHDNGTIFTGLTNCNGTGDIPAYNFIGNNILTCKLDSNEHIQWVKLYGGSGKDEGKAVIETIDKGYAILAHTESTDGDVQSAKGTVDVLLIRTDSNGNRLWTKTFGSPADDEPISVSQTPDSGFIILGVSTGQGDDIPQHYGTSPFLFDWFLMKTDKGGTLQWCKTYGGYNDESGAGGTVIVLNDGYYLVGSSNSTDHDCTDTAWHSGVSTGYDYYVLRMDTNGTVIWNKSYGGRQPDVAWKAMLTPTDSSIVIVGASRSNDYKAIGNNGGADMWVVNVDKNGQVKWAKMCGGTNDDGEYHGITLTKDGNYLAGALTFPGFIGMQDIWLFVIDTSGNIITSKQYGGTGNEFISALIMHKNSYLALGMSTSSLFTEGTSSPKVAQGEEAYISRFDYFPLKISEVIKDNNQLMVYPNPARSSVSIVNSTKQAVDLRVMDMTGNIMLHKNISGDKEMINISNWPKGIYLLHGILQDGTTCTCRFVHE